MKPAWLLEHFFSYPGPALGEAQGVSLCPAVAVTICAVYRWDRQSPDTGSCSGAPDQASPCRSWLMEPRQCCISRCPEQSIYYIYYLHSSVLTFLLGCLEAVELNWPAHLSCPQTCCCHTEYTLNGASVLTSSLQHPEVVKIYPKTHVYWAVSCVYTRWGIDIQVLCALCQGCKDSASLFCWRATSPGPGAAAVLQLRWICCQDLLLTFWVLCFKWCLYFHTVTILPLLCALKPL